MYSGDTWASYNEDSVYAEIHPGDSLEGRVYFDVPKGTKLTELKLNGTPGPAGARVRIG
jgi:hypothetical protein